MYRQTWREQILLHAPLIPRGDQRILNEERSETVIGGWIQIATPLDSWTDVQDYVKSALYCCILVKLLHSHLW